MMEDIWIDEVERVFFTEHLGVRVFETVWSDGQYSYEYYTGVVMGRLVPSLGGTYYHERQDEERVHEMIEEWVNG